MLERVQHSADHREYSLRHDVQLAEYQLGDAEKHLEDMRDRLERYLQEAELKAVIEEEGEDEVAREVLEDNSLL